MKHLIIITVVLFIRVAVAVWREACQRMKHLYLRTIQQMKRYKNTGIFDNSYIDDRAFTCRSIKKYPA